MSVKHGVWVGVSLLHFFFLSFSQVCFLSLFLFYSIFLTQTPISRDLHQWCIIAISSHIKEIFCLHYTIEHTQRSRHGRLGQPGPRYVLIVVMSLQQNGQDKHQITSYMGQSRTRKPQKPLIRKNRDRPPPTKCSGGILRLIFEKQNER